MNTVIKGLFMRKCKIICFLKGFRTLLYFYHERNQSNFCEVSQKLNLWHQTNLTIFFQICDNQLVFKYFIFLLNFLKLCKGLDFMGFYPSTVQCEFPKFSIYFGVRSSLLYLVRENSSQHSETYSKVSNNSYVMLIFFGKKFHPLHPYLITFHSNK